MINQIRNQKQRRSRESSNHAKPVGISVFLFDENKANDQQNGADAVQNCVKCRKVRDGHKNADQYLENKRLFITLSGRKQEEQWNSDQSKVSFFSLKGVVMSLLQKLGIQGQVQEQNLLHEMLADGLNLSVLKNNLGSIGWVNPAVRKHFGIKNEVFVADLDWDAIMQAIKVNKVVFSELPKAFEMRRDYSLLLDKHVSYAEIERLARQTDRKLLRRTSLFDVYEGDKLEAGKKSYAVAFYFQDPEQTLKDEVVDHSMQRIRTELESKLGAQLR